MRTRNELNREALQIIHNVSTYRALKLKQIYQFFPKEKEDKIRTLMTHYFRDKKLFLDDKSGLVYINRICPTDFEMIKSVWVMLDFWKHIEYHTPADYPVKLWFFYKKELYGVVYIKPGHEQLISQSITLMEKNKNIGKYIVIIEDPDEQIKDITLPNICGYCTVTLSGKIKYYQEESFE